MCVFVFKRPARRIKTKGMSRVSSSDVGKLSFAIRSQRSPLVSPERSKVKASVSDQKEVCLPPNQIYPPEMPYNRSETRQPRQEPLQAAFWGKNETVSFSTWS